MRLFIAINFGGDVKNTLLALRDELRSHSERGSFSLPENLHLTLAFLGECDAKQTAAAKAVMDAVSFEPFDLLIDRVGCFRRDSGKRFPAKPQDSVGKGAATERAGFSQSGGDESAQSAATWWAGASASEALMTLQHKLTDKLISAGFELDKRRYSPHITLGREVLTDHTSGEIEPFGETVCKLDLMKSERIGGRLAYTSIYAKCTPAARCGK